MNDIAVLGGRVDDPLREFADALKSARPKGMTQEQAAAGLTTIGLPIQRTALAHWERGLYVPSVGYLFGLAVVYGLDLVTFSDLRQKLELARLAKDLQSTKARTTDDPDSEPESAAVRA